MRPGEFASHLGVSPGYVSNLKRAGRLVFSCDGKILVDESINRIEATKPGRQTKAVLHRRPNLIAALSAQDHRVSRIVKMHYQAIMKELEASRKRARLTERKVD